MTAGQFEKSTPKKLQSLFNVYKRVNGIEEEEEFDCIDNVIFQGGDVMAADSNTVVARV